MAPSHSPRSAWGRRRDGRRHGAGGRRAARRRESYRDVLGQPLRDVQVVDLHGDLLAVAWLGHSDGRQVLNTTHQVKAAPPGAAGPPRPGPHLGGHAADGRDVVAGADEVPDVLLQLEVREPPIQGLGVLQRNRHGVSAPLSHAPSATPPQPRPPRATPPCGLSILITTSSQQFFGRWTVREKPSPQRELLGGVVLCRPLQRHRLPPGGSTCRTSQNSDDHGV
ncbi:hypothetical protein EYF80_061198 [Liparis tanakae]|uniref:Uncharacterized protein n=1 Tax=Liparis tanakae TaxID=230148 RepID=A0A4Z2EJP6_9TELE|nr:hypothetical protein EYF80_061198 [Liparis tanakae]